MINLQMFTSVSSYTIDELHIWRPLFTVKRYFQIQSR